METIFYREVSFTILELSGRPASRPTWRQYFSLKQAIIFVVDASDHVRIREAQVELHRMIASSEEEYSKLPIFIVGTKMVRSGKNDGNENSKDKSKTFFARTCPTASMS